MKMIQIRTTWTTILSNKTIYQNLNPKSPHPQIPQSKSIQIVKLTEMNSNVYDQ